MKSYFNTSYQHPYAIEHGFYEAKNGGPGVYTWKNFANHTLIFVGK